MDQAAEPVRIGLDWGGTKIAAVALGPDGVERARRKIATPRDYQATIDGLTAMVAALDQAAGRAATVGVAMPGVIAADGNTVSAVNLPWLSGRAVAADLAAAFGRPVRLANDGDCFTLSEAIDGAAAGLPVVFGAVLGTGVGGGIVAHQQLLAGRHGIAGEWGHLPLPWRTDADGPVRPCACGRQDCLEGFLSGSGLVETYRQRAGDMLDPPVITILAGAGKSAAVAVLESYRGALARSLALVIGLLDPDAIVIGGGLSELPGLYDAVPPLLGRYTLIATPRTRLLKAAHGAESGMRGAAWLWRENRA